MGALRKCEQNTYLKYLIENSNTPVTAVYKRESYGAHKGSSLAQHCAQKRWLQGIHKEPHVVRAVKYIINVREMTQFTTGFSGMHCVAGVKTACICVV
jgi:hypothetical protein